MIQLLNTEQDGLDVTIAISKNLNFLLYIYRYYDYRSTDTTAFENIQCDEQGLMSSAFFHLRAITLWNSILYEFQENLQAIQQDEKDWEAQRYDFMNLFKHEDAYQALRDGFDQWWKDTGEAALLTLQQQIKTTLQSFPLKNLDQTRFLIYPLYDTYPESLSWNSEFMVTMTPQDIIDHSKVFKHLTFMSKS